MELVWNIWIGAGADRHYCSLRAWVAPHISSKTSPRSLNRIIDVWHLPAGALEDRNRPPVATTLTAWHTTFSPSQPSLACETLLSWATLTEAPKLYVQPSYFHNWAAASSFSTRPTT